MNAEMIAFTLKEVETIVLTHLIPRLSDYAIFAFTGPLGAGKTTIIKEFLRQAGVAQTVTSPTFTYVKQYTAEDGKIFHHFDLYRLRNLEGFLSLGFDEYLYDENGWCVIEWPEIINDFLQNSAISRRVWTIKLDYVEGHPNRRSIEMRSLS